MTSIEPLLLSLEKSEGYSSFVPGSGFALFLIALATGYQVAGLYKKWNALQEKVASVELRLQETKSVQEEQEDTLEECNGRICEKKDYDESDEVQEGYVQAWQGKFGEWPLTLEISISRSKESTIKKNQEWEAWDKQTTDASCTVRDFYLGNSNPEFHWEVDSGMIDLYRLVVSDTLINGWDSVINVSMTLSMESKETLLEVLNVDGAEEGKAANSFLKQLIDEKKIVWTKVLLPTIPTN